jgi:aromatic-L-amino-acid decarboxylase
VYASREGHSSIEKAALLAGFGRENLRLIDTDDAHALRVDALESAVAQDVSAGRLPCAIVACVGTTGTTAVDPLRAMTAVAREHGAWLHVDAAMAGTAMALPECRHHWEGVEEADSLVFNPHKWMGVGFDLSAYYVRDPELLVRVMSTHPSYLKTTADGQVKNFRDWHIQLGRRFRSLKLWFYLADVGVEGLRARLRRDLANAAWLSAEVRVTPDFELVAPTTFQTVCLRHVPPTLRGSEDALTEHNLAIARRINESGEAYVTPSVLKGRQIIRVSIGAEGTERRHVEHLWQRLQDAARES